MHYLTTMPVRKRPEIEGRALVSVTTSVTNWLPVFKNKTAAHAALEQLGETARYFNVSTVGYVLMPSHLHTLLGFSEIERLSRFMQSFKSLSSRRIEKLDLGSIFENLRVRDRFRLWRPRFDDLVIHSDEQFRVKLDYIHNNPVKAGLVRKAIDWPFSSARDWLGNGGSLLEIDKEFVAPLK
jgi:putative transposase